MKRMLSLVLACFLALSALAGCASDKGGGLKSDDASEEPDIVYARGVTTETSYESEYLGLRFTLPEGCTFKSDADLAELMNIDYSLIAEDLSSVDFSALKIVYEVGINGPSELPEISIAVDNIGSPEVTVSRYIEDLKMQLMNPSLEIIFSENVTTAIIAERSYQKLECSITIEEHTLLQNYYVRRMGERMVVFTVSFFSDMQDEADLILAAFTKY